MGQKRTPQQLQQIADVKGRALAYLDKGQMHITTLRDHLQLTDPEGARLLEAALREARDKDKRVEQVQGKRGLWRGVTPGQQPLPVGQPPSISALTGLKEETVEVLRAEMAQSTVSFPTCAAPRAADWLGTVLEVSGKLAAGGHDQFRWRFLQIAALALRAYEAMS